MWYVEFLEDDDYPYVTKISCLTTFTVSNMLLLICSKDFLIFEAWCIAFGKVYAAVLIVGALNFLRVYITYLWEQKFKKKP
jgi:hypothetical protein